MSLHGLVERLRESRGFRHKTDIAGVVASLASRLPNGTRDLAQAVAVGDDCAAIADGDSYLLLAIEGLVSDFVETMPWFAGYSSVMVNISDVYAMGGRPLAVVDALWSDGLESAEQILAGMAAASSAYGVPVRMVCLSLAGIAIRVVRSRSWRYRYSAVRAHCCRASMRGRATAS